jgi:hypothetical protein
MPRITVPFGAFEHRDPVLVEQIGERLARSQLAGLAVGLQRVAPVPALPADERPPARRDARSAGTRSIAASALDQGMVIASSSSSRASTTSLFQARGTAPPDGWRIAQPRSQPGAFAATSRSSPAAGVPIEVFAAWGALPRALEQGQEEDE